MERSILKIKRKDKITIKSIREKTKGTDAGYIIKKLKFKHAGHLARIEGDQK